ncbi:hypothetical protein B0T09DRAFT_67847 [Sordaria sp. MPI-SDFR-AT-0083]|nr:hypothetical protein B0T09DRAFT_67847 [Sordaria sp. MPI-SDFR-AT-0083]
MRSYTRLSLNGVFASLILVASVFVHDISTAGKSRRMLFILHAGYIGPFHPMGNCCREPSHVVDNLVRGSLRLPCYRRGP